MVPIRSMTFFELRDGRGKDSSFSLSNSVFKGGNFQALNSTKLKFLSIVNTTFEDIKVATSFRFISLEEPPNDGNYSYIIKNTTFKSLTVSHSVIRVNNSRLEVNEVKFDNINLDLKSRWFDIDITIGWLKTACLTSIDSEVVIKNSNFTNINKSCLGIQQSDLTVENCIFNNSGLVLSNSEIQTLESESLDENSGVSWIHIQGFVPQNANIYPVEIRGSKFIENKMQPLLGGVKIWFSFNLFVALRLSKLQAIHQDKF